MTQPKTPQETIDFTLRIGSIVKDYLSMEYWTPAMGALLLAGLRPPLECTEIPQNECLGLDDAPAWNQRLREAKIIFKEWTECHEDEVDVSQQISPYSFLMWCVDARVQEDNTLYSKFPWIDIFKDAAGYKSDAIGIPYGFARELEKYVKPLDTILAKLEAADVKEKMQKASAPKSRPARRISTPPPNSTNHGYRTFLTTEELAEALGIQSASIFKAFSSSGSYFGIVPEKGLNRRLMWPLDSISRLKKISGKSES